MIHLICVSKTIKINRYLILLAAVSMIASSGCETDLMESSASSSSHNSGEDCLAGGCHATGENQLTIAGTLYTSSSSSTEVTGGIVTVSNGTDTIDLESDQDGNFYTNDERFSSGTMTSATASGGSMVQTISLPSGCNSCHTVSGDGRIF